MASSSDAISAAPAVDQAFQAPADHLHSLHATPDAHAMGSGRNIDPDDGSLIREPPSSSITPPRGALKQAGTSDKKDKRKIEFTGVKAEAVEQDEGIVFEFCPPDLSSSGDTVMNDEYGVGAPAVAATPVQARM